MTQSLVFDVDKDIIQKYDNEDIKVLSQDLINITLEVSRYIR